MRPRVFPAEDIEVDAHFFEPRLASMRPRVFPAEDVRGTHTPAWSSSGFNEAAGIPRGRLVRGLSGRGFRNVLQ